eukprot:4550012-Amphidinium_carterae.1
MQDPVPDPHFIPANDGQAEEHRKIQAGIQRAKAKPSTMLNEQRQQLHRPNQQDLQDPYRYQIEINMWRIA